MSWVAPRASASVTTSRVGMDRQCCVPEQDQGSPCWAHTCGGVCRSQGVAGGGTLGSAQHCNTWIHPTVKPTPAAAGTGLDL